jgi:hypothetical protein
MTTELADSTLASGEEGGHAVEAYLALAFKANSNLRADLLARLEADGSADLVAISDVVGAPGVALTSSMEAWLNDHVAGPRRQAIEQVKRQFTADKPHNGAAGCLIEAERETIEDRYVEQRRLARKNVRARRRSDLERIELLERDIAQHQAEYATEKARLGREPVIPNRWLYLGLMIAVGVAEAFINYDAFRALAWATPFIATGTTFAIGMVIALAAHMHGTLLKRFRSYFDDDVDEKQRWVAVRMFSIGTLGLGLALTAVSYSRNVYFAQTALGDLAFGGGAEGGASKAWIIGGSLLGNMIIYVIGVVLAFLMHDEVARYPELRLKLDSDTANRTALISAIDQEISQSLKAAEATRKRALEQLDHRDAAQRNAPRYAENRRLFEQVTGQDSQVLGALQAYRSALVQARKADGNIYKQRGLDDGEQVILIDGPGYQHLPIKLKYN